MLLCSKIIWEFSKHGRFYQILYLQEKNCYRHSPHKIIVKHFWTFLWIPDSPWRTFFKFLLRLALGILTDLLRLKGFQILLCNSYLSITGEYVLECVQDFFYKLGIKPLVEIIIFSPWSDLPKLSQLPQRLQKSDFQNHFQSNIMRIEIEY